MKKILLVVSALSFAGPLLADAGPPAFNTQKLTDEFYGESAGYGDINGDGKVDVASGAYWYEGPDFNTRHQIYKQAAFKIKGYSNSFFTFVDDVDGDGKPDVIRVGWPGKEVTWFKNPGKDAAPWEGFLVFDNVDGESPAWVDINGDGKKDLVAACSSGYAYWTVNPDAPEKPWTMHRIAGGSEGRYEHGFGVGDVNKDGRPDFVIGRGWFEQPASLEGDPEWKIHLFGGDIPPLQASQMPVYDFDGDGDNDIVASRHCHQYGFYWLEQDGGVWKKHVIMGDNRDIKPFGISFSQTHAVILRDVNQDGLHDIVTGKRYYAHNGRDPGAEEPAVLYWFETQRKDGKVSFVPHLIHDNSGVGVGLDGGDLNGDGKVDFVTANKKGTYVHLQQ